MQLWASEDSRDTGNSIHQPDWGAKAFTPPWESRTSRVWLPSRCLPLPQSLSTVSKTFLFWEDWHGSISSCAQDLSWQAGEPNGNEPGSVVCESSAIPAVLLPGPPRNKFSNKPMGAQQSLWGQEQGSTSCQCNKIMGTRKEPGLRSLPSLLLGPQEWLNHIARLTTLTSVTLRNNQESTGLCGLWLARIASKNIWIQFFSQREPLIKAMLK